MKRKKAREEAVKLVYQMNMLSGASEALDVYVSLNNVKPNDLAYIEGTVKGVENNIKDIDAKISANLKNWSIDRISQVSLAAMRVSVYEMLYTENIPVSVAVNEAVDIVTEYDEPDNASFVNGVLGSIARSECK